MKELINHRTSEPYRKIHIWLHIFPQSDYMKHGSIEMLKGRIAEAIVEEMFKEAGYMVYRFGYEAIIQNLSNIPTPLKKTPAGRKILSMPDFIIIKDMAPDFLEVKYRAGDPRPEDSEYLRESWPEAKILFVCKKEPHFRIARVIDFVDHNYLFPLEQDKYSEITPELIKKYSKQVIASYGV